MLGSARLVPLRLRLVSHYMHTHTHAVAHLPHTCPKHAPHCTPPPNTTKYTHTWPNPNTQSYALTLCSKLWHTAAAGQNTQHAMHFQVQLTRVCYLLLFQSLGAKASFQYTHSLMLVATDPPVLCRNCVTILISCFS